jgi:hypothetical protein
MDIGLYRKYLQQYVIEGIQNSDGSNRGIAEHLDTIQIKGFFGFFIKHKEERLRALADARQAFDRNRHWPLDIILSHLGVEMPTE